jgi:hypothetical protein
MDVTTLAPAVLPYLVRYLPAMIEAGKFAGGKALEKITEHAADEVWKIVQPWIGKLMGKIEDKPTALSAAQRVALSPENKKYQTALEVELEEILAEDRYLAEEIKRILDQAKASGKQTTADHGGVAFGDNARDNITITGEVLGDFIKQGDRSVFVKGDNSGSITTGDTATGDKKS